ncbi:VOC family protein [uncultured Nocardioides sp.]|uniref:VOC family protein n=1 Tax=uncultured Nocardioides sp. TaxID=198441 RepID=UPI00260113C3|nr:VOC family protein [uncultured Nocardioides sp.]
MARFDSYPQGTPSWIEHSGPDPEASKQFYAGLFGWQYDDRPMHDGETVIGTYSMARVEGDVVAGLSPRFGQDADSDASWGVYLAADDVDTAVARAREAGGRVEVEPVDVGEEGRMAWVHDPVGALVGLWQGRSFAGSQRANEHGTTTWNELVTGEGERALPFYEAVLGVTAGVVPMGDGAEPYTTLEVQGRSVGGIMAPHGDGEPAHWNVYFHVDDADEAARRTVELGGQQVVAPFDVPGIGRMAAMADPQGARFNLMQPPAE